MDRKITVHVLTSVTADPQGWAEEYGLTPGEVAEDVRKHVIATMREAAAALPAVGSTGAVTREHVPASDGIVVIDGRDLVGLVAEIVGTDNGRGVRVLRIDSRDRGGQVAVKVNEGAWTAGIGRSVARG